MKLTKKQVDRFWKKVIKTNTCWNWTASKCRGYGKLKLNGSNYQAHRMSLFLVDNSIPVRDKTTNTKDRKVVTHICDNRSCVNPKHLRFSTQKANIQDAEKKGRMNHQLGENHNMAKLTLSEVLKIRKSSLKGVELSKKFMVSPSCIYDIIKLRRWKTA